jgi:hypothetical protein
MSSRIIARGGQERDVGDYLVEDNQCLPLTIEYNKGMIEKLTCRKKYLDTEVKR